MSSDRERKLNTNLFFHIFSGSPGKNPGIFRPEVCFFLGFEGHTEFFGTHPFTWKTPTPLEDIRTQKCGFVLLFLASMIRGRKVIQRVARRCEIKKTRMTPREVHQQACQRLVAAKAREWKTDWSNVKEVSRRDSCGWTHMPFLRHPCLV